MYTRIRVVEGSESVDADFAHVEAGPSGRLPSRGNVRANAVGSGRVSPHLGLMFTHRLGISVPHQEAVFLGRTSHLDPGVYEALVDTARMQRFDTAALIKLRHGETH